MRRIPLLLGAALSQAVHGCDEHFPCDRRRCISRLLLLRHSVCTHIGVRRFVFMRLCVRTFLFCNLPMRMNARICTCVRACLRARVCARANAHVRPCGLMRHCAAEPLVILCVRAGTAMWVVGHTGEHRLISELSLRPTPHRMPGLGGLSAYSTASHAPASESLAHLCRACCALDSSACPSRGDAMASFVCAFRASKC